ncbi:type I-E CRISPR-associated protein Cas6/Cse3/CasE [Streptomyces sp. NPDC058067]|uniref:type I-E CRISPR-associated protein Cas6/Cse3/CasE n=1 Tax=Streptomyces sp. NPDC058067 TaxID=3346324 RepID=UPI0036DFEC7B
MTTDLWLTRIVPNPRDRDARRDIRSAVGLHHRVMLLFPDGLGAGAREKTGALFRLDESPHGFSIIVQSGVAPDLSRLNKEYGLAQSKYLTPLLSQLTTGTTVHYRLTANATRKLGQNTTAGRPGQIVPLHGAEAEAWWERQTHAAGLSLLSVHSTRLSDARGERASDKRAITHARTRFDGAATVTDVDALTQRLAAGIGRGKSYGCGLLSIAPAR